MKLSLVPTERRFYELFRKQGQLLSETLSDLSKSMLEGRSRHPRLRDLEHQADNVTHEIYRLTNRTFVTPIDQEDILLLAHSLDEVVDRVVALVPSELETAQKPDSTSDRVLTLARELGAGDSGFPPTLAARLGLRAL